MKPLAVITWIVLIILELKVFDCADVPVGNVTLLIPPSKYSCDPAYCGLSPSEMAALSCSAAACSTGPSAACSPVTASVVKSVATSPRILGSLSAASVRDFLDGLSGSPSVLQSVPASDVARLVDTLCASPCLLKSLPLRTVIAFVTSMVACPGLLAQLPVSTVVRLVVKLDAETPAALCGLSPAVRLALLRAALDPETLETLRPSEIVFLLDYLTRSERALAELPPSDVAALLTLLATDPVLSNNLSAEAAVAFLLRVSRTAPFVLTTVPANVTDTLLLPVCNTSSHCRKPCTLVDLTVILTSSPSALAAVDPAIASCLVEALSPHCVLCTVPPVLLVKLLTEISLSADLLVAVGPRAVIGLLYAIKTVAPAVMCEIPPSVRSAYVLYLTSPEVFETLSVELSVKLVDTLIDNPCILVGLPSTSIRRIITLILTGDGILNSIPPCKIVGFVHQITVVSPFVLREINETEIASLLSPLSTVSVLSSLDPCCFAQLVSSFAQAPFLLDVVPPAQLVNILTTIGSSCCVLKAIPSKVYVDILTQIFATPLLLTEIPLTLLLDLLVKIENCSPSVLCSIPSFAISEFMDFLGADPATFPSLSPLDITRLLGLLTKSSCFLSQISVATLSALLEAIAASPAVLYNIPVDIRINLFYSIYTVLPSIFYSLPPDALGEIVLSFDSFETLSSLSTARLIELITVVSEFPRLFSFLDAKIFTNILNVLSASPASTLCVLKPCAVVNLLTSITSTEALAASVSPSTGIRFLNALSTAAPSTLCCVPASVYAILLSPLESIRAFNGLTLADVECLVDLLIETPCLLTELPPALIVNLLTVISKTFTTLPHVKIVVLLASIHSVSPSLLCLVDGPVLADLLDAFVTGADLCVMPPKFVEALVAVFASSPCLLEAIPAAAFDSFLGLLTTSPKTLQCIPAEVLGQFFTKLSLTPSALNKAKLSLIVSLLSSGTVTRAIPPIVINTLLAPLTDPKTVFDLEPADIASLICAATSNPRILSAIAGAPLDGLLAKVASSRKLLSFLSSTILVSFFDALTCSPAALCSVNPSTLVNLLTTVAMSQPTVVSTLSPSVATALLKVFDSQTVLATLPPPVVNSLLCLLLAFPNLLAALPLCTLDALLQFLVSSPAVLVALPACTVARLLAALSSLPPLLRVLPPGLLASFLSAVSAAAPEFLCTLPPTVVTSLLETLICEPALASSTPETVASLISTLNRSPCLVLVLPGPVLISFLTYLTTHPCLLKSTSKKDLLGLVHNVRTPASISRIASICPPPSCSLDCCGDFSAFQSFGSPTLGAGVNKNDMIDLLETSLPNNPTCKMICAIPEMPIPNLVLPDNAKGATVYVRTNCEQFPTSEKTTSTR